MPLRDIFCQDKAVEILQKAFSSGKVPHAYIFGGQEGVGKFTTAREWAKLLLCNSAVVENGFADSCGSCQSCRLFQTNSHPDFNHIYKELLQFTKNGKDKTTPIDLAIDVIREFLIEKVYIKPALSERKVFIIDEAERLNVSSQNCLLKVMEEPPKYCYIILLCTRLEKLLPTIKSRCQIIRFGLIDEVQIIEKLKGMGLSEKPAQYFARLAGGSLGQACQWAGLELAGAKLYDCKKKIVSSLASYQLSDALDLAQEILEQSKRIAGVWIEIDKAKSYSDINRKAHKTVIQIIISVLYDVMGADITPERKIINLDQKEYVQRLGRRFDNEQAAQMIAQCYKALRWVESAVNEKLIFEQLLLNLAASDKIQI